MPNSPIYMFLHIPKTAGTTLNRLLQKHFGRQFLAVDNRGKWIQPRRNSCPDANLASNNNYLLSDLQQDIKRFPHVRLIAGHSLKPYIDLDTPDKAFVWFTYLRKPESRFISNYIHQQTSNQTQYHMPLEDWCRNFHRKDFMVRMIAGEENLNKAIDILESKFKFVGLSESFDESLPILKKELQLKYLDIEKPVVSEMKGRDNSLKDEIYNNYHRYEECILENNQLDIQLYEYAKHRFSSDSSKKLEPAPVIPQPWGFEQFNLLSYKVQNNLIYKLRKRDLAG